MDVYRKPILTDRKSRLTGQAVRAADSSSTTDSCVLELPDAAQDAARRSVERAGHVVGRGPDAGQLGLQAANDVDLAGQVLKGRLTAAASIWTGASRRVNSARMRAGR